MVSDCLSSNFTALRRPRRSSSGPANPNWFVMLVRVGVVQLRGFEFFEDGIDVDPRATFAFEDLLVVPQRLAVADLDHRRGGVGEAGDFKLQGDATIRRFAIAAADGELLFKHVDRFSHVGRDGGERGEFGDGGVEGFLGVGREVRPRRRRLWRWPARLRRCRRGVQARRGAGWRRCGGFGVLGAGDQGDRRDRTQTRVGKERMFGMVGMEGISSRDEKGLPDPIARRRRTQVRWRAAPPALEGPGRAGATSGNDTKPLVTPRLAACPRDGRTSGTGRPGGS